MLISFKQIFVSCILLKRYFSLDRIVLNYLYLYPGKYRVASARHWGPELEFLRCKSWVVISRYCRSFESPIAGVQDAIISRAVVVGGWVGDTTRRAADTGCIFKLGAPTDIHGGGGGGGDGDGNGCRSVDRVTSASISYGDAHRAQSRTPVDGFVFFFRVFPRFFSFFRLPLKTICHRRSYVPVVTV